MIQGQSEYTLFKERRFAPVLAQSLRISKASSIARFAYYHIDLNAGGGYNTDVNVPGSPLNFIGAAERNSRLNFYAFFVDSELAQIKQLIARPEVLARADRVAIFHADNKDVLPVLAEFIAARERHPHLAIGTVLIDPNGYHKGVPWDALRTFCADHPRFDVVMNLNIRQFQLERAHIKPAIGGKWATHQGVPAPWEFIHWFSRPNWMFTRICAFAGNRWLQGVGRTMRTNEDGYLSLGYYDFRSDIGRRIITELETPGTAAEFPLLQNL